MVAVWTVTAKVTTTDAVFAQASLAQLSVTIPVRVVPGCTAAKSLLLKATAIDVPKLKAKPVVPLGNTGIVPLLDGFDADIAIAIGEPFESAVMVGVGRGVPTVHVRLRAVPSATLRTGSAFATVSVTPNTVSAWPGTVRWRKTVGYTPGVIVSATFVTMNCNGNPPLVASPPAVFTVSQFGSSAVFTEKYTEPVTERFRTAGVDWFFV
jgi:hypothetical protein